MRTNDYQYTNFDAIDNKFQKLKANNMITL